jgi:hypothetical protein
MIMRIAVRSWRIAMSVIRLPSTRPAPANGSPGTVQDAHVRDEVTGHMGRESSAAPPRRRWHPSCFFLRTQEEGPMPTYLMSCTHCAYEVAFRTEPDAKTEGVRHLLQFPAHGVKVTPSEDAMIRDEERVTA